MTNSVSVFVLPLDGSTRVEPLGFFLANVAPPGSFVSWADVADHLISDEDCLTSVAELAARYTSGVAVDPVRIGYGYDGQLCVFDGTHRVMACAAADVPVRYALTYGDEPTIAWLSVSDARLADEDTFDALWSCVHSLPVPSGWVSLEFASSHPDPDDPSSRLAELGLAISGTVSAEDAVAAAIARIARLGFVAVPRPDLAFDDE